MAEVKKEEKIVYLIGSVKAVIKGRNLPTNRQVLQLFLYKHDELKLPVRKSARDTIEEVRNKWSLARIPVCGQQYSISKLEKLHLTWQNLKKNIGRKKSPTHRKNEKIFKNNLDNLFDIAQRNVMNTLMEDSKIFLTAQRDGNLRRFLPMSSLSPVSSENSTGGFFSNYRDMEDENTNDSVSTETSNATDTSSSENVDKNIEETHEEDQVLSQSLRRGSSFSTASFTLSCSPELLERVPSNFDDELDQTPHKKKKIINTEVAATCDRIGISNPAATLFTASILRSLGLNVNDYNFSSNTFRRRRNDYREKMAQQLKNELKFAKILELHWDGKLLPRVDGDGKIDRLPIVVTGLGTEQFLGAPALDTGTGLSMVEVIVQTLNEWGVTDRVKALCFDTTSSNTGRHGGACTLLEQRLHKSFLHLACRHHISELILRSVVETYWKGTSGPNVPIFQRFQKEWNQIDKEQYRTGMDDELTAEILTEKKDQILAFIANQFEITQPRSDYQEFLELACIFLGGIPPRGIKFKKPGANHHARWLSKAIYCLKIFIFSDQFFKNSRNSREITGLRHICIFVVLFYVEIWYTAPCAIKAPQHDLSLMQNLIKFQDINPDVSQAALNKLKRHLWYLNEELATLAFFDPTVETEIKKKMVDAIKHRESTTEHSNRIDLSEEEFQSLTEIDISHFINKKSMRLFELCELPHDFLDENPMNWKNNQSYMECSEIFHHLKVVNDVAERGVALVEGYTGLITRNEEQYQYLLQVVKVHRTRFPNCNKKTFTDPIEADESLLDP